MAEARVPISSLPALLALDDTEFVRAAYATLLGRDSDDTGLDHFTRRLRDGEDKRRLIADLALSDEGRRRQHSLPGLEALAQEHQARVDPWPQRAARALLRRLGAPSREPVERALRAADNRLYRIERALLAQTGELVALRQDLARVSAQLESLHMAVSPVESTATVAAAPVVLPRQAPLRVEQLFRQMRRTAARHSRGER
jgi:hypothetical protein